jgi:uncharacterized protein YbjT (DUF2867 family)
MNILLTGANGFIGQHLLQAILANQHHVTICCRNPNPRWQHHPQLTVIKMNFSDWQTSDWLPHLQNIDTVINAVGIIQQIETAQFSKIHTLAPCALFQAAAKSGVKKIIQISALGAELNAITEYFTSKAQADEFLKTLPLDWFIFKPSIVYGQGAKSMALLTALAALPLTPLIGEGQQQIQPVYIGDLVNGVLVALNPHVEGRKIMAVVGEKPLAVKDLLSQLAAWLNQPFRAISIPARYLKTVVSLGKLLAEPSLNKDSIAMLEQGNTACAADFAAHLGYPPKNIEQTLQTACANQAERWQARLYFIRPLLKISLALVWIWAGIVSAVLYPVADSYQMLQQVGISGIFAPLTLYGASLADFCLGVATLYGWRLRLIVSLQVAMMLMYSAVITIYLPEVWLHPFGAMIKNLPMLCASFVFLILEEERP